MIVHRSNRTEVLVEQLGRVVEKPGLAPFEPELLVVQGQGMERWLSMRLAERLGVWANHEVLSLRKLVDDLARRTLGAGIDPAFDPESLMWSVAELLTTLEQHAGFESIARYLEGDTTGRRRIQLSYQIATTFYRYMTYREEMVNRWSDGSSSESTDGIEDPDEQWQATLWRELVARHGGDHLAGRGRRLISHLARGEIARGALPKRISVFGVSTLPRLHLDLFHALARHVELHLFVLSPTPEYWGDIATPQEARRELRRDRAHDEVALHLDVGHPLLSSLGKLGRDLHEMLVAKGDLDDRDRDQHREPEGTGMLVDLQRDILAMRVRGRTDEVRLPFDPADRSLRIHACHGAMREVEVLCEELVACFEADGSLEPQDVVVMTPDIKTYAPYVEAVFGVRRRGSEAACAGEGRIPYRIADRWPDPADEVVDALRRGLDFVRGRFAAPEAIDLLGLPCVQRRFGFDVRELEVVETWIEASGIRWGVDAAHRGEQGQPDTNDNTWWFGLDRLLLGYAMEDDGYSLYEGVRPFGSAEGQRGEVLGRLLEFGQFLFEQREALRAPRSPSAWREALVSFLEGLIVDDDDNHDQHWMLRDALAKIARQASDAGYEGPIALESMREQIDRQLDHAKRSTGFLAGGVTFCELVPMRSIPFRVVCLLGMNDEAFPRIQHVPGFDLVARSPRIGDRTSRDDDRYLFLEALLSARDRLVITYVGQSIKDGALLPPSAVVSELVDVLCETYEIEGQTRAESRTQVRSSIELRHPLQPFSPKYFDGLQQDFSVHSELYCEAARRMVAPRHETPAFAAAPMRDLRAAEVFDLEIDELVSFFRAPVASFLKDRLGIGLREDRDEVASREPYRIEGLDRYVLGDALVDLIAKGVPAAQAFVALHASGGLPHAAAGTIAFDDLLADAGSVAQWTAKLRAGQSEPASPFELELPGVRLHGTFLDLGESGQVFSRYTRLGGPSELSAWIWHLALLAVGERGAADLPKMPFETAVVGREKTKGDGVSAVRFAECANARETLGDLVDLYRAGSVAPLPLFRSASRAFAERMFEEKGEAAARKAARKKFDYDPYGQSGDCADANIALAFQGVDPLDPAARLACGATFEELALRVFVPLLTARRMLR